MISGDFAKAVFYKPLVNTLTVTTGTVALIWLLAVCLLTS